MCINELQLNVMSMFDINLIVHKQFLLVEFQYKRAMHERIFTLNSQNVEKHSDIINDIFAIEAAAGIG